MIWVGGEFYASSSLIPFRPNYYLEQMSFHTRVSSSYFLPRTQTVFCSVTLRVRVLISLWTGLGQAGLWVSGWKKVSEWPLTGWFGSGWMWGAQEDDAVAHTVFLELLTFQSCLNPVYPYSCPFHRNSSHWGHQHMIATKPQSYFGPCWTWILISLCNADYC